MDYWDGDILLSLYQQGYMVLKCNKRELRTESLIAVDFRLNGSFGCAVLDSCNLFAPSNALTLNVKVGVKPLLNKEAFCWELSEMNCMTSTVGDTGRILILYAGAQSVECMKV